MKLQAAFDEWMATGASIWATATIDSRNAMVRPFLREYGRRELTEITHRQIALFVEDRLKVHEDNPNGVRLRLMILRTLFKWCRGLGYMTHNPFDGAPRVRRADVVKVPFTWEDYQELNALLPPYGFTLKGRWADWRYACLLAFHTGLRLGDCASLKWEFCDFINDIINAEPRKLFYRRQAVGIPMAPELREHLISKPRLENVPWVDPGFRHEYLGNKPELERQFRRLCNKANLWRHSFHSFRHGMVTRLLNAGADSLVVCQITGQSLKTVQSYAHISMSAKRQAMDRARNLDRGPAFAPKVLESEQTKAA